MTQAVLGAGTKVYVKQDDLSFAALEGVVSVAGPEIASETVEVTDSDSTAKEYIQGLPDAGTIAIECNWFNETRQKQLRTAMFDGESKWIRIERPDGSGHYIYGPVQNFTMNTEPNGPVTASFSIKVSEIVHFDETPSFAVSTMTDLGLGSVVRSTTATYIKTGYNSGLTGAPLATAAINVARFEEEGLLIEPKRTNYVTNPQGFNASPWSTINGPVTIATNRTDPLGTTTAQNFLGVNGAGDEAIEQAVSGLTNNKYYTGSIWGCVHINSAGTKFAPTVVNNGTRVPMVDSRDVTGGRFEDHLITDWAPLASPAVLVSTSALTIAALDKRSGSGVSDTDVIEQMRMWGAQIEMGKYATRYQGGTREYERAEWGGGNFDDFYTYNDGGAFYLQGKIAAASNAHNVGTVGGNVTAGLVSGDYGDTTNIYNQILCINTSGDWAYKDDDTGVGTAPVAFGAGVGQLAAGDEYKALVTWDETTIACFVNGVKVGEVTRAGAWKPTLKLTIGGDIGATAGTAPTVGGHIQGWAQFRSKLSDAQGEAITTHGVIGIG